MKKKSYRHRTKIVRRSNKNLKRTTKRKHLVKGRKRTTRRYSRIQRGGLSQEEINILCLPPNKKWKKKLAKYISIHSGKDSEHCVYDKNTFTDNWLKIYSLWNKLTLDQKIELENFMMAKKCGDILWKVIIERLYDLDRKILTKATARNLTVTEYLRTIPPQGNSLNDDSLNDGSLNDGSQ